MDYLRLRPSEFRAAIAKLPLAFLPLGTLEWHGEHLPLGSDALQAHTFFLRAAKELGGVVLPPLFLGPDQHDPETDLIGMDSCPIEPGAYPPQKLNGSAYWVNDHLFAQIVEAVLSQLSRAGFKLVVAHGHGPSTSALLRQKPEWEARFGLKVVCLWNELGDQGLGFMVDHAAANETSIMMALHPDLVDLGAIKDQEPLIGIAGQDPRIHASAEVGEAIIRTQIEWLRGWIREACLNEE